MAKPNNDNMFGSKGSPVHVDTFGREAFVNRPTKGKTKRKKIFLPKGTKTNIGDPCKSSGGGKRK